MKEHTTFGRDTIIAAEKNLDQPERFLEVARDIAYCHHEKWDGSGYPQGLSGEDIPLSARLMALCDVYDALTTKRVYKDAIPHGKASDIIIKGRGSHFDPAVVDAFIDLESEFLDISERFKEPDIVFEELKA